MTEELTPEQKFNAESPETMIPRALREGRSHESIIQELIQLDWEFEPAQALVERVANDLERYSASPESRAELINECRREMIIGLMMTGAGMLITVGSFLLIVTGVLYIWIIATGAIIYGLIRANRGYSRWRLYRKKQS